MSLRTFPLIIHPAFVRFVEASRLQLELFSEISAQDVPTHRPDIQNITDISRYLGVSPLMIRAMLLKKAKHYRSFSFQKRAGGVRQIDAPRTHLKVVQWWIYDTILNGIQPSPHSFGFVKNRSFVDNARFHLGSSHLLNVDVANFFPSISTHAVEGIFRAMGYREAVAAGLAQLTTYNSCLPQGAPTSPSLANIFMLSVDSELNEIASQNRLKFSRYADDITMSGRTRIPASVLHQIRSVLAQRGLRLNDSKTRFLGPNQQKDVTGLILAADGVAFTRCYLNAARGWFHQIKMRPVFAESLYNRVRGTTALIKHVGGRGSCSVLRLGAEALQALEEKRNL